LHVGQLAGHALDEASEFVLLDWERNHGVDLQVRVRGGTRQQLELLAASTRIAIEQPRPFAATTAKPTGLK
jgi:hypothetical protein